MKDNIKPRLIDWLIKRFDLSKYFDYKHSFKDQWINVNIYNNQLSISIDSRQPEQVELFNSIPKEFIGCNQYGTGLRVNLNNIYIDLNKEFDIQYPNIIASKIINTDKHYDNDDDIFYCYTWELQLSDNTSITYTNQTKQLDISDFIFKIIIQEKYLNTNL